MVEALSSAWPAGCGDPEVWVVDDGSSDGTADVARAAGATVLRHPENRGKGAALVTGLTRASECGLDVIVSVDADGQHPADEAAALLCDPAPLDALVLGVRDLASAGAPRANQRSNAISNFFLTRFSGRALHDTQCGLRRYPVRPTLELGASAPGYAFEAEVVLRAARAGWAIAQRPVRVLYPSDRVSHFHVVRDPAKIVGRVVWTLATTRRR